MKTFTDDDGAKFELATDFISGGENFYVIKPIKEVKQNHSYFYGVMKDGPHQWHDIVELDITESQDNAVTEAIKALLEYIQTGNNDDWHMNEAISKARKALQDGRS